MPLAARFEDPVGHSAAFIGARIGTVAGAAIGVLAAGGFTVLTEGAGIIAAGPLIAAGMSIGCTVGEMLGSYIPLPFATGKITSGSPDVLINDKLAARAKEDKTNCIGTPPLVFLPSHDDDPVAEGSASVYINSLHAARVGDMIACRAQIRSGSEDVNIGGPKVAVVKIADSEVPAWYTNMVNAVGFVATMLTAGPVAAAIAYLLPVEAAPRVGRWVGRKLFPNDPVAQDITEATFVTGATLLTLMRAKGGNAGRLRAFGSRLKTLLRLEPIDVGSGRVVDAVTDLSLPGAIPFVWERSYSSAQAEEWSSFGWGGWTHNFDQRVVLEPDRTTLRDEEGCDVYFPALAPGQSTFHRCDRLVLRALDGGEFEVLSLDTRLVRAFAPVQPGGDAVLRSIRDSWGNTITLEYVGDHLSRIVDTAGRQIRVRRGHADLITRVEVWAAGRLSSWVDYSYTDGEELAGAMDALGQADRYGYDEQHRMVKKTRKNGVSFHYAYDDRTGWCCRSWGDGGVHTGEIRVDLEKRVTYLTENEEPRVYHWNEDLLVVREETADGLLLRARTYDAEQYLIAEQDGAGETIQYEYDARGNKTCEIDPAGNVTKWEIRGDLPVRRVGPDGLDTTYAYDERGALRRVVYPSGLRCWLDYDERGLLTAVRSDEGVLAAFAHAPRGDLVEETDARGSTTRYEFDALGRPIARTDALGQVTRVAYDAVGRPIKIERPDGSSICTQYDPLGNPKRVVDALGQVTVMDYTGTGALAALTRPDGSVWRFEHNAEEKLRRVINPRGEAYEMTYDAVGRVIEEATFDGRVLSYRYSAAGRIARIDYSDGSFREFTYDALGHVIGERSLEGRIELERDRTGRLLGAVLEQDGRKVRTSFQRDALGRVVAEVHGERALRSSYDVRGRRVERVMPDGSKTFYGYDAADDLAWVEHEGHRLIFGRDALGREITRDSGASRFRIQSSYDALGRLLDRRVQASVPAGGLPEVIARRAWRYDELGRVTRIEDKRWGATEYRYDAVGQLIEACRGRRREIFAYDPAGALRRIVEGMDPAAGGWEIGPGNQVLRAGGARYDCDHRARRVRKHAAEGTTEYHWDSRDRLREVHLPTGSRVRLTYDAFGRRVRKEVLDPGRGEYVVDFLWDGDVLAAEVDSRSGMRVLVHAPDSFEPLLEAAQGEVLTYVCDHLGTPRELLDPAGKIAWCAAYGAFGDVKQVHRDPARAGSPDPRVRLPGHYADDETGLACAWARCFDPELGRWCSPDPLGLLGGDDLIGYGGAPTVVIDPLGLEGASPLALVRPGTQAWKDAVAALRDGAHTGPRSAWTDIRVEDRRAAQRLLTEAMPGLPKRRAYARPAPLHAGFELRLKDEMAGTAVDLRYLEPYDWRAKVPTHGKGFVFFDWETY